MPNIGELRIEVILVPLSPDHHNILRLDISMVNFELVQTHQPHTRLVGEFGAHED